MTPHRSNRFAPIRSTEISARGRPQFDGKYIQDVGDLGPVVASSDDSHLMTIAPTGAGKGRDVIIPNLLTYSGSLVVFDPKGENYDVTHKFRAEELGHKIILLDPFHVTGASDEERGSFNPLDVFEHIHPQNSGPTADEAGDFGRLLADILMGGINSFAADPFWDEMSQMLVGATISDLMTNPDYPNTLEQLRKMIFSGDIRGNMAEALEKRGKVLPPGAVQEYEMLLSQDEYKTFPSIVVTAAQHLSAFGTRASIEAMRVTSFDLSLVTDPRLSTSVYIVIPPHKLRTHKGLLRAWIGSLLYLVMNRPTRRSRLLFMIDEAAQLGRFSLLEEAITLLRGYGLRTWTFWQDLGQIFSIYGQAAETMINNSGVLQVFGTTNLGAVRRVSQTLGFAMSDLIRLSDTEQMVALRNEWPAIIDRINYLDEPVLSQRAQPNRLH